MVEEQKPFEAELDVDTPSNQAQKVFGEFDRDIISMSQQDDGRKYAYRLIPFNAEAMAFIGIPRPVFEVKKYMFQSATEFKDDKKEHPKYVVTTAETCVGATDTFGEHVDMRLAEMQASGNEDGLNKHNSLFSNQWSRKDVSPEKPLTTHEIGKMESWIPVIPVDVSLDADGNSVPLRSKGILLNVKTTGKNQIFGSKSKTRPEVGLVSEVGSKIWKQVDGVDFFITKAKSSYKVTARRDDSSITDNSFYLDKNLPNPLAVAKANFNAEEAIRQYDIHIGYSEAVGEEKPKAKAKKTSKMAEGIG